MIILNDLLWFSILIPSFALAGHFVVYRSLARFLRPVEYVWLATTCGMLVFTAAVFALGVIHVFTWLAAMAVIASLWSSVLFARVRTRSHVAHLTNTFLEAFKRCHRLLLVTPYLSVMTILIAGTAFLGCLTPEVRGDPIIYHITEAWLYVLAKGHIEIRSSALTYIPQNQQLLYALGLCLGSDSLAKLLHWLPGVLLLLGAMTLARRLGLSRRYAVAGGFLLATCPVWFYLATTTYIDLAVGNYLLCAVFLMVLGAESLHVRRLSDASAQTAVAGIFTGAALGCKYTAGIVGYAPMALSLLWLSVGTPNVWKQVVAVLARYSLFALLVFLPWLIRNWLWTGNPVAPSFLRFLGPNGVPESTLHWPDIQATPPFPVDTPAALIRAYVNMVLSLGDYGNFIPAIAIVLGAVNLLAAFPNPGQSSSRPVRFLVAFLVISLLLGVPTAAVRRDSRYVMAHVVVLSVLCIWWFWQLCLRFPRKKALFRRFASSCLWLLLLSGGIRMFVWYRDLNETIFPILSQKERDRYCAERLPDYLANKKLAEVLKEPDVMVLGASYPAAVLYVLGGMPLSAELSVQNPRLLSASHLPGLTRYGVTHLFGDVAPELEPYLERVGKSDGKPIWRILRVPQPNRND